MRDTFVTIFHSPRKGQLFGVYPGNKHISLLLGVENEVPVEPGVPYLVRLVFRPADGNRCYVVALAKVGDVFKDLFPQLMEAKWERKEGRQSPETDVSHKLLGQAVVSFCYYHQRDKIVQYFRVTVYDRDPGLANYWFDIPEKTDGFYLLASQVLKQCGVPSETS